MTQVRSPAFPNKPGFLPSTGLKILVSPVQSRPCPLPKPTTRFELWAFFLGGWAAKVASTAKVQPNREMNAGGSWRTPASGGFATDTEHPWMSANARERP